MSESSSPLLLIPQGGAVPGAHASDEVGTLAASQSRHKTGDLAAMHGGAVAEAPKIRTHGVAEPLALARRVS